MMILFLPADALFLRVACNRSIGDEHVADLFLWGVVFKICDDLAASSKVPNDNEQLP